MANRELDALIAKRTSELISANEELQQKLAERQQIERALRESENQFRALAETASDAIITIDEQSSIVFVNRAAERVFGYSQREMMNREITMLMPEYLRQLHRASLARYKEEGRRHVSWDAIELSGLHKSGAGIPLELAFAEFIQNDKRFFTGIARDITERKLGDEKLRRSEALYRTLAHNFPNGGVALFDRDLRYLIADGSRLASVGLSKETLEGRTIWEAFSPEVSKALEPIYRRALAGESTIEELQLRGRVFLRQAVPISDEHGEIFAGMVMSQDITDFKKTGEELRRKESDYRNLVESVQAIVWRADARTFQFSFVSKEAEKLLGYPAAQWVSDATFWRDHLHPNDRDRAVSFYVNATKDQRNHEFEYRMIAADGREVWLRDIVRVVAEDEGVKELVGVMVDVTARKLAEDAASQTEKKFSAIFHTIPDVVSIWRIPDGLMLDLNDAWTVHTGYLKSDRIGKTAQEFNIYTDQEARTNLTKLLLETGEVNNHEAEYRIKDGSLRHGLTSARVIELGGEQCSVAITRDVTDLKMAQEAVRQSEEKFRTLADTTPSAIVVHRFDQAEILYVNPAMEEISGYSQAELRALTMWDLIHPDCVEIVRERRLARLRGERISPRLELKLLTKSGEERWVDQSIGTIEFEGEAALIVTAFDITDRKRAEEALRRSEERYRLIVENQTEFIVKWLPDGTRTFVNESYCRYFGITEQECIGTSFFPLVAPEFRDAIQKKTASLTPVSPEYTEEHLSIVAGGRRWQQWTNRGIFDAGGNLIELLSTGRDITERKTAEEALQESEARGRLLNERFSLAVESAGIGVWDLDLVNNHLTWDQQMYRLYHVDPREFSGAYEAWAQGVHPEDITQADAEVQQAVEGVRPFDTAFRVIWPNGEARHIRAFARVVRDDRGSPIRMTGINYDITDRRRAEAELRQSREQLRALSSHLQSVREEERTHIAREVHDELGQALTALKIDLYALQRDLIREEAAEAERLTGKIKSMFSLIDTTIQSVRRIATELRPGILDDLGLVAAIEWQANDFQTRTGIHCEVASGVDYVELDRDRSTAAFRILQETLTNVARHACASKVGIELKQDEGALVMEVQDNGKGITTNDISSSKSLGLLGMRERAQLLGGDLTISGAAGHGTRVTVSIPL